MKFAIIMAAGLYLSYAIPQKIYGGKGPTAGSKGIMLMIAMVIATIATAIMVR